jgi:hypothetical protein
VALPVAHHIGYPLALACAMQAGDPRGLVIPGLATVIDDNRDPILQECSVAGCAPARLAGVNSET